MAKIIITKECSAAIRAAATLPFRDTGRVLQGGRTVEVELSDDTYEGLQRLRFAGETFSDTILRALAAYKGKPN